MKASLKARLKRLELNLGASTGEFPVIVFGERGRLELEISGIDCNGRNVQRRLNETVKDLVDRAGIELRQKIVFLAYAAGRTGDTCVFCRALETLYSAS